MDVYSHTPLTLTLSKDELNYILTFENASLKETGRGTHKGLDFIKTITNKIQGSFDCRITENSFKITISIRHDLLD